MDLAESETGSEEDVTGKTVAHKTAAEKPYAPSKSACQGRPKAEKKGMVTQSTRVSSHRSPYGSSILDRQGIYGREHHDTMNDLDVNMAIWVNVFLNATLRAAVHLGQDCEANLRFVKNHLSNSVGQLFRETGKLISDQKRNNWYKDYRFQRCHVDFDKLIV